MNEVLSATLSDTMTAHYKTQLTKIVTVTKFNVPPTNHNYMQLTKICGSSHSGHCKTWTLDSGLDHGLDYGPKFSCIV